jgi:hypothetical protein
MNATISESNIMASINNLFTFLITCNFSLLPIVFRQFFAWIALGDADLRFSLALVRKASVAEEQTK